MTTKVHCTFNLRNVTPGAVRYDQATQDGKPIPPGAKANDMLVGTLYLRKAQLPGTPESLTVTVEY